MKLFTKEQLDGVLHHLFYKAYEKSLALIEKALPNFSCKLSK
jgi:hypothetical protein